MAGGKGPDALGSLLTDFGGLEGAVFSSRKPMSDMRTAQKPPQAAPVQPGVGLGAASSSQSRAPLASAFQAPKPASAVASSPPAQGFAQFDLDSLVSRSSSAAGVNQPMGAARSSSMASMASSRGGSLSSLAAAGAPPGPSSLTATAGADDFDALFGVPAGSAAAATPPQPGLLPEDDPFAIFGGAPARPPSNSSSRAPQLPLAQADDGQLLAGFAAVGPASQLPGTQPESPGSGFGDFEEPAQPQQSRPQPQQQPAAVGKAAEGYDPFSSPATAAAAAVFSSSGASPPRQPAQRPQRPPPAGGPTATLGYARSSSPGEQSQRQHKAFDYLDAREGQEGPPPSSTWRTEVGGSGAAAEAAGTRPGALHPDAHGRPKEVLEEVGQRAAKALQSGTRWFMRASKTLVKEVQSKLHEAQHGGGGDSGGGWGGGGSSPGGGSGSGAGRQVAPYYYDWAAQLSRMSPTSRGAALGAMAEEDRLPVQQILDEAVLGDSYMEGPDFEGVAPAAGPRRQQQPRPGVPPAAQPPSMGGRHSSHSSLGAPAEEPLPPPSYDDLYPSQPQPERRPTSSARGEDASTGGSSRQAAAPTTVSAAQQAPDLLGVDAVPTVAPQRPAAAAAADLGADLLFGMGDDSGPATAAGAPPSTSHIDDMFSVPRPASTSSVHSGRGAARPAAAAMPRAASVAAKSPLDSMIDLGADLPTADTAGFEELYNEAGGGSGAAQDDEPEVRRQLRARKAAEKHARMAAQLAEKRARDESEAAEKAGKVEWREQLKPRIDGWAAGKKDNIRALLSSMHTVMWEGSGWTAPNMADLLDGNKVKRYYMKANLVVHPDKVKQKGGTLEQVATADMVFDVLKVAWGKFDVSR